MDTGWGTSGMNAFMVQNIGGAGSYLFCEYLWILVKRESICGVQCTADNLVCLE